MQAGYESLVRIRDDDGRENVCNLDDVRNEHELNGDEGAKCINVSLLIGTEKW